MFILNAFVWLSLATHLLQFIIHSLTIIRLFTKGRGGFFSKNMYFPHDRSICFYIWMLPEGSYHSKAETELWENTYALAPVFVWDEPDKTWPRLPRTFTQKWINLFNHAELPLCIPDEAVGANLFLLSVFPAIFESLNMLGKVLENTRGDIMTVCGSGHVPRPVFTTEACAPPLVFLWVSMWELGFVKA